MLALLLIACHSNGSIQPPATDDSPEPVVHDDSPEQVPGDSTPEEHHLPVLIIDTDGVPVNSSYKIDGTIAVITRHDGTLTDLDDARRDYSGPIGVEIHGTSSSGYPKLSLSFELRDDAGEDLDVDLLDLGSDSDWVLAASYGDKTYVRNALGYSLGRELAAGRRWEAEPRFVEVIFNRAYNGIYTLTGRAQRDKERIDIAKPAASEAEGDITGGYIVRLECGRDAGWTTNRGSVLSYSDPQSDQITSDQSQYLQHYFNQFETMLSRNDFGENYPDWIDTDAWIDHILVQELAHNIDGLRLSTPIYKHADPDGGLLVAGPLWDFDRAFGNVNYCYCYQEDGWIQDSLTTCGYGYQFASWWSRLREDPAFQDRMRCRWEELRQGIFADEALDARVMAMIDELREAEPRDQAVWHTIGLTVDFNYYVGQTWQDEIDYLLNWLHGRAAWMDGNVPGTCQ